MMGGRIKIEASGAVTYFRQILSCVLDAVIEYRFNGTLADAFSNATIQDPIKGVIFKYDAITASVVKNFQCVIKLVDDFGNSKTLDNTVDESVNEAPTWGRRLLSAFSVISTNGASLAVWSDTELQYSVTNNVVDTPTSFPAYGYVLIVLTILALAGAGYWFFFRRNKRLGPESLPLFDGTDTGAGGYRAHTEVRVEYK